MSAFLYPTAREILDGMSDSHRHLTVTVHDVLDSTNSEAKRRAPSEGDAPTLTLARTQTAGRGRLGRSFHSPADTGLYMSLSYLTRRPLDAAVTVTAAAAVAVTQAVEALSGKHAVIKWVNDVYLDGAKVSGILTESIPLPGMGASRVIVGIGINVTTREFPDGLRAPAASIASSDSAPSLGSLASAVIDRLMTYIDAIENGHPDPECLGFYRERSMLVGEEVLCTRGSESFSATVRGIGEDYSLLLTLDDGTDLALSSGEVSVRKI